MSNFKKGDAVICDDYGVGYVVEVTKGKYPVSVEFRSDNSIVDYTLDGRSVIDCDITLNHSNHKWEP
jgi:hypothetical protein